MQPHSEVPTTTTTTTTKASATTTNSVSPKTTTTTTTSKDNNNKINNQSPSLCKLVKGRRPLVNFNFYLDIKDHQISKKVEERITELGGNLEFFLTKSVTHFITDRSLPAAPSSSCQKTNNNNNNGHCVNSPSTGVGVNGGGVGGGGGGGGLYPITPSPFLQSPQTPTTPKTPYTNQSTYSGDSATDGVGVGSSHSIRINNKGANNNTPTNNKKKISRADAMLHRALQSQQQSQHYTASNQQQQPEEQQKRPNLEQGTYRIWSLEYAIRFLKKVTADVKQYAKKAQQPTKGACEPIQLKGHFIKIEAISGSNRPYYSVFRNIEWPKIQLGGENGGAFRLTPPPKRDQQSKPAKDKPSKTNAMTRKSRSSSKHNPNHMRLKAKQAPSKQATEKPAPIDNSSEKQCGVCEICKIEYDTLTIHLKTKDHEFFARNQNNYLALDSLIKTSASVDKFLEDTSKEEAKEDSAVEEEPMEVEEESTRSTRKSSRKQTPPPPPPPAPTAELKIKTKLKEVEVVTTTTNKKQSYNNVRKSSKLSVPLDSPPIRHPLPNSTIYKVVADSKAQTDPISPKKSSIIVKFRKIRQTELSVLNGEAENFMFPRRPTSSDRATDSDRQTSTDSNRISSSSISSESHLTEELPPVPVEQQPDSAAAKRRKTADNSHKSTTMTSVCYQSFPNTPIQPNKITSQATKEHPDDSSCRPNSITKPLSTTQRKRGNGRKRRAASRNPRSRNKQQRWNSEDRMGDEDGNADEYDDEEDDEQQQHKKIVDSKSPQKSPTTTTMKQKNIRKIIPAIDLNQGRIKEQIYAFERLPVKELWFEVFRRQDACQERMFEYWGSTSYRKLPYEIGAIPTRTLSNCKICTPHQMVEVKQEPVNTTTTSKPPTTKRIGKLKKIKKERKSKSNTPEPVPTAAAGPSTVKSTASKTSRAQQPHNKHLNKATFLSCDLMPRKSPREHASTLAILSCLIKQRKDSEIEEQPPPKEKTPEKRKTTPSPVHFAASPRNDTPEPLQFVSEISENVKRLRRGQRKFEDFIPTTTPLSPKSKNKKPSKPKGAGLEFEVDEKRLKSLETTQKSSVQLEQEIDAYLGRISMKSLRQTPNLLPTLVQESSSSSGFVDDFTSDIDLIDLIDCYDGGGGEGDGDGNDNNLNDQPLHRPAINNVYNLFSAHNRRRKPNKANKTGWPTTRRRNPALTRQNHLLQKSERFRFFCDYQTRQRNSSRLRGGGEGGVVAPTTTTSMTPPDTDLDDKDDCTRSSVPDDEDEEEVSVMCKDDILNNSCMSPSEKADNSDIFTVSSDGLETDLDISCHQIIKTEDIDDECTTSSTIAAPPPPPPATSERELRVKSPPLSKNQLTLAMKNIIKKEVKVSCKRLRTPFRRFRQRR